MNNRELKFRVWDKSENCFSKQKFINLDGIHCNFGDYHIDLDGNARYMNYDSADLDNNAVVQQYTGTKDHKGVEIYEGDILKYGTRIGTIQFFAGMFVCDWQDQTDETLGFMMIDNMEVIGNIFENAELLK